MKQTKRHSVWHFAVVATAARRLALVSLSLVFTGCGAAATWTAFHANGPNSGFIGVHSALAPFMCFHDAGRPSDCPPGTRNAAWVVPVGRVLFGGPVIGPDGTIYVGNVAGELIAVNPAGNVKWKWELGKILPGSTIVSSPAVDDDGNVYVIATSPLDDKLLSSLYSFKSDGTYRWLRSFFDQSGQVLIPRFTTTSPKLVRAAGATNVLVYLRIDELAVLDTNGRTLSRLGLSCPVVLHAGGLSDEDLKELVRIFVPIIGLIVFPLEFKVAGIEFPLEVLDPTPAVVSSPRLVRDPNRPIVVVADTNCSLQAFEWDTAKGAPTGPPLWRLFDLGVVTSPAVAADGRVVLGTKTNYVTAFDVRTGKLLWDFDAREPVLGTPAFFLGALQVYAASTNQMFVLEDGQVTSQVKLPDPTAASPAVTWDRVYVSDTGRLHALTFDVAKDAVDGLAGHGTASPAVGPNGTLYVLTANQWLVAYPAP